MSNYTSVIFGPTRPATEHELAEIQKLVTQVPVNVFQALNQALNERGFMLAVDSTAGHRQQQ